MMVPRAYSAAPSSPPRSYDEKDKYLRQARPKEIPRRKKNSQLSESTTPARSVSSIDSKTSPLQSRTSSYRHQLQPSRPETTTRLQNDTSRPTALHQPLRRRQSAQDVLAATAIPIRRKPRQRPQQRLPNGDHVSEFSRLLLDDIKPGHTGSLSNSLGNPQFEGLFGHIDELVEGEMIVGSGGLDAGILSTRSISTESVASLASPEDFSSADNASPSPSLSRGQSDRKIRQLPRSESCEEEHPLMQFERAETPVPELSISPPERKPTPRAPKPNAFKSSLTASLKAIKAAAQSVSNYATPPSIQPDEFLSHSVFDIQPSMTDDRRPPPSDGPPSPALRRYLNPDYSHHPDSPAQLHFWLDHRSSSAPPSPKSKSSDPNAAFKPKIKKKYLKDSNGKSIPDSKLPPIVPLASCIPPAVRTANASSPPIWLSADGKPSTKHLGNQFTGLSDEAFAAFGGLKQREPRENRDFLRVFVCEMEMRRHGKLADHAEGKARMWLPPVDEKVGGKEGKGNMDGKSDSEAQKRPAELVRWRSWTADEL